MEADEQRKHDDAMIEAALKTLGEHFDTVQVFVTRHEASEGGTVKCSRGIGNWYARYGHIKMWTTAEEQAERNLLNKREE